MLRVFQQNNIAKEKDVVETTKQRDKFPLFFYAK
jgi:hypothetical protein